MLKSFTLKFENTQSIMQKQKQGKMILDSYEQKKCHKIISTGYR